MTEPRETGPTLKAWNRFGGSRFGRWLFARAVCRRAPYFATIRPRFHELGGGVCRVSMPKRHAVENHIGTVHALAIANLCELAAGVCTDVSIPTTMRWIPRGMTIEYLRKAETAVSAVARIDKQDWLPPENIGVPVTCTDMKGTEVVRAVITMYVTARADARAVTAEG